MQYQLDQLLQENLLLKLENTRLKSHENSEAYKSIIQSSTDIIIHLNDSHTILFIHIPSLSKEQNSSLITKNIFDVTPSFAHEKMRIALESVFKGKVIQYESEGEFLNSYRYYDNYLSPIKDKNGALTSAYFRSREITAQKIAEKNIGQTDRTLKTVFENSFHFLTVLSIERKFIWFNKKAYDKSPLIFGNFLKIGELAESFILEENRANFITLFNKALQGETISYSREYTVHELPYFLEITLNPVYENGHVIAVSLIGVNITKQREYEDYLKRINLDLVQQNEQLNQYSHIVSHNLRAPMTTLLGLIEVFNQCKNNPIETEEVVRLIQKSANKFDSVIKDLNTIITLEDKEINQLAEIDLLKECDGIAFLLSSQLNKSGAEITYDFKQYPTIYSIKNYIHSILYNLISNSIKYKSLTDASVIQISCYKENDSFVCIECRDNGIGIDLDKYRDKLFGFYKRFHAHVEGKGLGLHLVKKQVDLLGGKIEVESEVNKGTRFKILLPIK
jgi:signal transduction histidine kinase